MGSSLHLLGLLFSVAGLVLLIFANIGTTFTNSFLPNVYFAEATYGTISIRFGPYNACILDKGISQCTKPTPVQHFDYSTFGINGVVDTSALDQLAKAYQFIVLIIPTTILAFGAMLGWLMIRENRSGNRLPILGAFASLFGMICGTATLALVIVCYQLVFKTLQTKVSIVYHWGPSLYLLGVGSCGCLLVSFILYIFACLRHKKHDDYTYFQKDEYNAYADTGYAGQHHHHY
ncbi:uncharacterized protein BX664DRAFT_388233 [Halteromyces radiatus]|uniref:uncharacterized protein n=1 Tax=Halteromyces radiatus TaxID=101107 RepID=UPI00221F299C|nr:uncharacterized protein BX664DRAFT_388233 [Halteromyces radiatus]KAI8083137.1 hypothetical protein BX664DRAFT_388233 [Halteromyces radiatus]